MLLVSCSPEYYLFLNSIKLDDSLNIDGILKKSGFYNEFYQTEETNINTSAPSLALETNITTNYIISTNMTVAETSNKQAASNVINEAVDKTNVVPKKTEPTNRREVMNIPAKENFSISLDPRDKYIIMKSLTGDIEIIKQDNGLFSFKNGISNSSIHFQYYDYDGNLMSNIYYDIFIKKPKAEEAKTNETPKETEKIVVTDEPAEQEIAEIKPSMEQVYLSSIEGYSEIESVREINKLLTNTSIDDNVKEKLRYKKLDLLINMRSFNGIESEIEALKGDGYKNLYYARYYNAINDIPKASRYYNAAAQDTGEIKKNAIIEYENVILANKTTDENVLKMLESETAKITDDESFYVDSMVNIARAYPFVGGFYRAEEIYKSIIDGDYSRLSKKKAEEYYDVLKRDYLNYR